MDHVGILEAAQHIGDGVDLADMGEELVAEPFALGGAAHQPGDIDEGEPRGDHLRGLGDGRQPVEPRVGDRHLADIRLDGAERIVGGLGRRALGQRVEQGGLADIGQPDDAAFESHGSVRLHEPNQRRSFSARLPRLGLLLACGGLPRAPWLDARSGVLGGSACTACATRDWNLSLAPSASKAPLRRWRRAGARARLIGLGEIVQHMSRHDPLPGMADADAHAHIVVADMR